jgi:hypothetical protein
MTEIKKKIIHIELIKWLVLPALILSFFGGLGGQEVPQNTHYQSAAYSFDSSQNAPEKIHNSDLFSFFIGFGDFEIEEEDDDNRYYSNRKSSQLLSLPLVINEITSAALVPSKKLIKLFILFHSWKSFLHI